MLTVDQPNEEGKAPPRVQLPPKIRRLQLTAVIVGDRVRKSLGDLDKLAASMGGSVGQLCPIGVTPATDGSGFRLVYGERRLRCAERLGWEHIDCLVFEHLADAALAMAAEHDENECRENFLPTELVEAGRRLESALRPGAEANQLANLNRGDFPRCVADAPRETQGKTRDLVSKALGVGNKRYERAKAVVVAAEAEPGRYGDLPALMDSTSVDGAFRELRAREQGEPQPARRERARDVLRSGPPPGLEKELPPEPPSQPDEFAVLVTSIEANPVRLNRLQAVCRRAGLPHDRVLHVLRVTAGIEDMPTAGGRAPWDLPA